MSADRLDLAFAALADPTRRAVIRALVSRPHRAGELAGVVRMSAPALSRHLRVLRDARLVVGRDLESDARVRVYQLAPHALTAARHWIDEVEQFWGDQLASFAAHVETHERTPAAARRRPARRGARGPKRETD